jgi:hypothetical protein
MSAKMTVANLMILVTFMSFIMYWRAGKQETAGWAKVAKAIMGAILASAAIAVIVLGVWGYFVPAIIRINLLLDVAGIDRARCHVDDHSADRLTAEECQDHDGNGLGQDASRAGYALRPQRGHGHPPNDADGLRTVVLSRPLACLWRGPRHVAIRVFTGARLSFYDHGLVHIFLLHACRLHLLGGHDGR